VRRALGNLLGFLARLWLFTLRVTVLGEPAAARAGEAPWVLAFLHGQQFALFAWKRRRPTAVMVSLSSDGEVQSRALPWLGLVVRRGSTSRGGARGLAAIVKLLKKGDHDAAFAVDGPKGPPGTVHPGAIAAARSARGLLVPLASACRTAIVLEKAWDKYEIPLPFSRVTVVLGAAMDPLTTTPADLAHVLAELRARALSSTALGASSVPIEGK
jgi:lysophospholipid acyltransferase (LPLAT)-like uncharacterized protein